MKYVRSVCPLPRGVQRHQGLQISTVTGYHALPAAQAGSCQARQASGQILRGHLKALPVPWNAICRPSPPRAAALGMQTAHATRCGGTDKVSAERRGVPGRGQRGEPLVPHDRMQGGEGGSALGFCEGKVLYPPVLTPRSTARLREGKM